MEEEEKGEERREIKKRKRGEKREEKKEREEGRRRGGRRERDLSQKPERGVSCKKETSSASRWRGT